MLASPSCSVKVKMPWLKLILSSEPRSNLEIVSQPYKQRLTTPWLGFKSKKNPSLPPWTATSPSWRTNVV